MSAVNGSFIGYEIEPLYGVAITPTIFIPVESFSVSSSRKIGSREQIRYNAFPERVRGGEIEFTGSIDMPLVIDGIGDLLVSALYADFIESVPSAGFYQYDMSVGRSNGNSFTFRTLLDNVIDLYHLGVKVTSLNISAAFGEMVRASFSFQGLTTDLQEESLPATFLGSANPINFTGVSIVRQGWEELGNVKSFSLDINTNLTSVPTLKKGHSIRGLVRGSLAVSLGLSFDVDSVNDWNLLEAGAPFSVDLILDNQDGRSLSLYMPTVYWDGGDSNVSQSASKTLDIVATVNGTRNEPPISATLITGTRLSGI